MAARRRLTVTDGPGSPRSARAAAPAEEASARVVAELLRDRSTRWTLDGASGELLVRRADRADPGAGATEGPAEGADISERDWFRGSEGGIASVLSATLRAPETARPSLRPGDPEAPATHRLTLAKGVQRWITDLGLISRTCALALSGGAVATRRGDSGEITAGDGALWQARLIVEGSDAPIAFAVRGDDGDRLRTELDGVATLVGSAVGRAVECEIRAAGAVTAAAGRAVAVYDVTTRDGRGWRAFWPAGAFAAVRSLVGRDGDLLLIDAFIRRYGMAAWLAIDERPGPHRPARFATSAVVAAATAGGVVARSLVDGAFRSGEAYGHLVTAATWCGPEAQKSILEALGSRRADSLVARMSTVAGAPWVALPAAAESIAATLATRCGTPGAAPVAALCAIVRERYTTPRSTVLRAQWQRHRDGGTLSTAVTGARLSRLRRVVWALPRDTVLRAAYGESSDVVRTLTAAWSRRGRRLFVEDLDALTALIDRGDDVLWAELLEARLRVERAIASRAGVR